MPPPVANNKQRLITIYVLIALGFAGLIGAHEISGPDENADLTPPFILAAAGTLCFVAAGLLARKLMKGGASR
jgi:alkylhydroperoxidase/carboxymuconolactone decarboxylase family protein YurZ